MNFDRLSTFKDGNRASTFIKYSQLSTNTNSIAGVKSRIAIYDILIDYGPQLIRDNFVDPLSRPEISESSATHKSNEEIFKMKDPLIFVARSTDKKDKAVWGRCFPHLLKYLIKYADQQTLNDGTALVWSWLKAMDPYIGQLSVLGAAPKRATTTLKKMERLGLGIPFDKTVMSMSAASSETFIENWKSLLIFAYTNIGNYCKIEDHTVTSLDAFGFCSPAELNRNILPLMSCDRYEIRKAAVVAAGCIQQVAYDVMLKSIGVYISRIVEKERDRKTDSKVSSDYRLDRIRTEITYLLSFLSSFAEKESFRSQKYIMDSIRDFVNSMLIFFNDRDVDLVYFQ
jgi:hypothetical protein